MMAGCQDHDAVATKSVPQGKQPIFRWDSLQAEKLDLQFNVFRFISHGQAEQPAPRSTEICVRSGHPGELFVGQVAATAVMQGLVRTGLSGLRRVRPSGIEAVYCPFLLCWSLDVIRICRR